MNEELEKVLIGTGGSIATWILVLARGLWRGRRRETAEEVMRKELWGEVGNLRKLLSDATTNVIEWQAKYLSLLTKHENLTEELSNTQERLSKIGELLSSALTSLGKIEVAQGLLTGQSPNLIEAQQELQRISTQVRAIRQSAGDLSSLAV